MAMSRVGLILLQYASLAHSVTLHHAQSSASLLSYRFSGLAGRANSSNAKPYNCGHYPEACQPPFDCQLKPEEQRQSAKGREGHAHWSSWCKAPFGYMAGAIHCQKGDLRKYATTIHALQNKISPLVENVDANYCFSFGHCDNFEVSPNTTLAESEAMCDRRFGQSWREMKFPQVGLQNIRMSFGQGLHLDKRGAEEFAKLACAMGNYHCDAIYCQQEYCSSPKWRAKWDKVRPAEMQKLHSDHYPPAF